MIAYLLEPATVRLPRLVMWTAAVSLILNAFHGAVLVYRMVLQ
jgi:hypothetical protein